MPCDDYHLLKVENRPTGWYAIILDQQLKGGSMEFKKGEKVICVDASNQEGILTEGEVYEITGVKHIEVKADNGRNRLCKAGRFEPAPSELYLLTLKVPAHKVATLIDHVLLRDIEIEYLTKEDE